MKKKRELLIIIPAVIVVAYILYIALASVVFENRFGWNKQIAGVDVGLKTKEEAIRLVEEKTKKYQSTNIIISGKSYPVSDFVTSYQTVESVESSLVKQGEKIGSLGLFIRDSDELQEQYNREKIGQLLRAEYKKWSVVPIDARIDLKQGKVIPGIPGQRLLLTESHQRIERELALMETETGYVVDVLDPMVTEEDAMLAIDEARKAVSEPITLSSDKSVYDVSKNELLEWLKVVPKTPRTIVAQESLAEIQSEEYFYFDPVKVTRFVYDLAQKTDIKKANAELALVNGSVQVQSAEKIGYKLDTADTIRKIQEAATGSRQIELTISKDLPEVRRDNLTELGITELISTGMTDFRGSPANRIHNFKTGSSKFNRVLIKPGEDFSFNKTLGPVDASTGYLPELVILENKTVPQYGGGLCQVSSTAFRAALNAGLPILERRYHAYPVSYYKPYGVDATIYLLKPDLVFKNDTGNYILIRTRISGSKLYFDFYGTKIARKMTFAGNKSGQGAVFPVESVNPGITDAGLRGKGSFTATVYRFIYDETGKLIKTNTFVSKYDSPDKYPH